MARRLGLARAGLRLDRGFQFESVLGLWLQHRQLATAAGYMTGELEARGLGWDQRF
jgi:hypothetical protein